MTQGLSSPIAEEAQTVVPLYIPDEKAGPKTMGVMASVCSLLLAAAALSENPDAWESLKADFLAEADAVAEGAKSSGAEVSLWSVGILLIYLVVVFVIGGQAFIKLKN